MLYKQTFQISLISVRQRPRSKLKNSVGILRSFVTLKMVNDLNREKFGTEG